MKLRTLDRILMSVGAFLTALSGVCVVLIGLRIDALTLAGFSGTTVSVNRFVILLCGAVLFIYGIYVMSLPQSYRKRKTDFVVQQTADGEMRISVHAMDGLVRKVMESRSEMVLKGMDVENRKGNVFIDLKLAVAKNISIPLAVASLQKDIKQYLLSSTGVDVYEVKVSVDTTDDEAKDSPYLMRDTMHTSAAGSAAEESDLLFSDKVKPDEPLDAHVMQEEADNSTEPIHGTGDTKNEWREGDSEAYEGD